MHETPWRDRGDGRATGQPQGLGPEAYPFSTSQGTRPEDARLPARRAYSSERRAARSAVAAGGSCVCGLGMGLGFRSKGLRPLAFQGERLAVQGAGYGEDAVQMVVLVLEEFREVVLEA
jgi:hypothetical protein